MDGTGCAGVRGHGRSHRGRACLQEVRADDRARPGPIIAASVHSAARLPLFCRCALYCMATAGAGLAAPVSSH
ncbi:hypothetical protein C6A77_10625 [Pseudomonas sp. AFG_SD02_1510_Pfu_092]|nr:hypothetical protein C6A77_10625 [Pseudomonas sp. AFG_SD02_1510_Pfu_092]